MTSSETSENSEKPPSLEPQASSEDKPPSPRGYSVALGHGGLPEVISPHLLRLIEQTGGPDGPIGRQFIAQPKKEGRFCQGAEDPLVEDDHEVAPGLIYKYRGEVAPQGRIIRYGRVLWTITRYCASYCRFCTRGREVGLRPGTIGPATSALAQKPLLDPEAVTAGLNFLDEHPEINEVILSGGDPLVAPQTYLTPIISELASRQRAGQVDIIRVGSRLPIANPGLINDWHYELLAKIKNPYLMVHINHPAELTAETLAVLNAFRARSGATVMSQTVLLKGVNDSVATLYELFTKMSREGIRPYYVYQNDPVSWARHFTVPIARAIKLWQELRPILSGVAATARFVIDTPFGYGKIPIPEGGAWSVELDSFRDFKGERHQLEEGASE